MPNGEQEQDPEGEASGGESGEWHSDGEGDEESSDPSDEEEVDSPPRRERRSKLTHDPAKRPRQGNRSDWAVVKASSDILSDAD